MRSQTATASGISVRNNNFQAATGYKFKEWNTAPLGEGPGANSFTPPTTTGPLTGNLHLFAIWEKIEYRVTINGGGVGATVSGDYNYGDTVNLYAGTRTGQTFSGWTVTSGGVTITNSTNSSASFIMPANNVTVTANWTTPTYQVTVNGSYGATPNSGAGPYAANATVTIRAGTRTGYTFNGWTVNSGGVSLANASNTTTTFTMPSGPVTVTANWTLNQTPTYQVTVNESYGATPNSGAGPYASGATVTIRAGTRTGYTFSGWTVTSGGVSLANANSANTTFTMPSGPVTVLATWTQNQTPTFQVTVNESYGATPNSGAGPYTAGATVTIRAGTRTGYTFSGWTVTSGGVSLANANSANTTFTMPSGPVTVTAAWTQNQTPTTFQVTVNGSHASNSGSGTYTAGQTVTIRAGSLSGNDFNRWTTSSSGVSLGSATNATTSFRMPSNNVTITATWTPTQGNDGGTPPPGGGTTPPPGGGTTPPPGGGTTPPPGGGTTPPPGGGTTPPDPLEPGDGNGNGNDSIINPPLIIEPPEQQAPPPIEPTDNEPIQSNVGNNGSNSRHVVRQLFGDNHPVMTIGDTVVPLVGPRHIATWALVNLILLICGILLAIYATTKTLMRRARRRRDRDEEIMSYMRDGRSFDGEESPGEKRFTMRNTILIIITCVLAVIGIILFIITQDMTRTMVLIDFWTIFHVLFVGLQIVALVLLAKKLKAVVTFRGNKGKTEFTEKVLVGETLNEPRTPVRKGYVFDGWYSDYEYSEKWEFYRPVEHDRTLYAKWKPEPVHALQQAKLQTAPAATA